MSRVLDLFGRNIYHNICCALQSVTTYCITAWYSGGNLENSTLSEQPSPSQTLSLHYWKKSTRPTMDELFCPLPSSKQQALQNLVRLHNPAEKPLLPHSHHTANILANKTSAGLNSPTLLHYTLCIRKSLHTVYCVFIVIEHSVCSN